MDEAIFGRPEDPDENPPDSRPSSIMENRRSERAKDRRQSDESSGSSRFALDFQEASAALNLSETQRNRLRWVARYDDQTFLEMLEAIDNADSGDAAAAESIIRQESAYRERNAAFNLQFRQMLTEQSEAVSAFLADEGVVLDDVINNRRLLEKCARSLNSHDIRFLKLLLKLIKKKYHLQPTPNSAVPLRDGLYGHGAHGEPGSVRATGLAVLRDGRALPALQASAALELVETRRSIERAEERDRRGGRPRKGINARTAHARARITAETKAVLEGLAAAGVTLSDILETFALGYRNACAQDSKPPTEPRDLIVAVASALTNT